MKNLKMKFCAGCRRLFSTAGAVKASIVSALCGLYINSLPILAQAATVKTNLSTKTVIGNILEVIFDLFMYIGVVLVVIACGMLGLALKDENADQQSRAVKLLVVAAFLIGIESFCRMAGVIS